MRAPPKKVSAGGNFFKLSMAVRRSALSCARWAPVGSRRVAGLVPRAFVVVDSAASPIKAAAAVGEAASRCTTGAAPGSADADAPLMAFSALLRGADVGAVGIIPLALTIIVTACPILSRVIMET